MSLTNEDVESLEQYQRLIYEAGGGTFSKKAKVIYLGPTGETEHDGESLLQVMIEEIIISPKDGDANYWEGNIIFPVISELSLET